MQDVSHNNTRHTVKSTVLSLMQCREKPDGQCADRMMQHIYSRLIGQPISRLEPEPWYEYHKSGRTIDGTPTGGHVSRLRGTKIESNEFWVPRISMRTASWGSQNRLLRSKCRSSSLPGSPAQTLVFAQDEISTLV